MKKYKQVAYYIVGAFIGLLFLLFGNLFYLTAWSQTVPDHFFTGINLFAGMDKLVYFSMIQQGYEGIIMMKNLHTAESQIGIFFSPHWWLIGQTAKLFSLSVVASYHIWRVILAVLFVGLVAYFYAGAFKNLSDRIGALFFSLFASGVGSYLMIVNPKALSDNAHAFSRLPVDLYMTETFPAFTAAQSPLFILSHIALVLIFFLYLRWADNPQWQQGVLIAGLSFVLILIHPYDVWILAPVIGMWTLWYILQRQSWQVMKLASYCIAGVVMAVIYVTVSLKFEPVAAGWLEQNLVYSPALKNYLLGLGFIIPFWILGTYYVLRYKRDNQALMLLVIWSWMIWLLIYFPISYNRRFANGWMIPLGAVGFVGFNFVLQKIKPLAVRWMIGGLLCVFIFSGTVINVYGQMKVVPLLATSNRFYLPNVWKDIYTYIQIHSTEDDVVLTNATSSDRTVTSLGVPAFTGRQVYIGHQHQTVGYYQKQQLQDEFWSGAGSMDREAFLRENNIRYLIADMTDVRDQYDWLLDIPHLQRVLELDLIRLYEFSE